MIERACPICGGRAFRAFNGRMTARCESCGSLERSRYQWLVFRKFVRLMPGAAVAHFAPERFFMDHFAARPEIIYLAFDKYPEHYRHPAVAVRAFDLCHDLGSLKPASFDLIMHSHVLEHLPCAAEGVLHGLARLLKPGGAMLFSVPIKGETSREGIDPAVNDEERAMRAVQGEHMRVFGSRDFPAMVADVLGQDCLVRQAEHFTPQELAAAHVPLATRGEPTSKSVFLYRKDAAA
jgi:SAM-dependent methyltransferase